MFIPPVDTPYVNALAKYCLCVNADSEPRVLLSHLLDFYFAVFSCPVVGISVTAVHKELMGVLSKLDSMCKGLSEVKSPSNEVF